MLHFPRQEVQARKVSLLPPDGSGEGDGYLGPGTRLRVRHRASNRTPGATDSQPAKHLDKQLKSIHRFLIHYYTLRYKVYFIIS